MANVYTEYIMKHMREDAQVIGITETDERSEVLALEGQRVPRSDETYHENVFIHRYDGKKLTVSILMNQRLVDLAIEMAG